MKLYSGGLTQFFLGDCLDNDFDDVPELESVSDLEDEEATTEEVVRYFETFRDQLAETLSESKPTVLKWSEAPDGPHKIVSINEKEFGSLLTIAARVAIADKRMNPVSAAKEWHEDPAVIQIQYAENDYLPVHHLVKADSWLPAEFTTIIETEVPERDLIFGSLTQVATALKALDPILNTPNEATRKLSPQFVSDARSAHLAMLQIVEWAATHAMPVLIEP
jgi:hypothetical protein